MSDDLVTWLRARLDDDERVARAADQSSYPPLSRWRFDGTSSAGPKVVVGPESDDYWMREINSAVWTCDDVEDGCPDLAREWSAEGEHIARHDPATVLLDIAAKRKILDEHGILERKVGWIEVDEDGTRNDFEAKLPVCRTCVPKHSYFDSREDVPTGPCVTVKLLALSLAGRPGYRAEWRPA